MDERGRILVVDDEPINVMILRKLLGRDYELAEAADGLEALQQVDAFRPQLVLLDVMMPRMDGYEACRRIKTEHAAEFVQVLLCSARGAKADRLRGYENLADDYVVKPFDHAELCCKVRVTFRLWERCRSGPDVPEHRLKEACDDAGRADSDRRRPTSERADSREDPPQGVPAGDGGQR